MFKPSRIFHTLLILTALSWPICSSHAQNTPVVVQSIADLRALDVSAPNITNGTVALVADYYPSGAIGGGRGGGHFRWVSPSSTAVSYNSNPADDGGRFIYPNVKIAAKHGVWVRLLMGEVANVKMWGARGDGIADDYVAITNAINATTMDNTWAAELLIPDGTYMLTNTVILGLSHVRGEFTRNSVLVMRTGYLADILRTRNADNALHGRAVDWDHYLAISDLALVFQARAYNTSNSCLVVCQPGEASTIRNIACCYGGIGIRCLGSGAPGLSLKDVQTSDCSIAGVSVEPIPGMTYEDGNPVNFDGVSGDMSLDAAAPKACLIRFVNSAGGGEISKVKAEGDFGGGVIQFSYAPNSAGFGGFEHGYLQIHNCSYNSGQTVGGNHFPTSFLALLGGNRTPSVTLSMLTLYGCPALINDQVGNRIVDADTQNFSGGSQMVARDTISYESCTNTYSVRGTNYGRLVRGQTAFSYFYPTNGPGWYRVMQGLPSYHQLSGKLVFNVTGHESVELNVEVNASTSVPIWFNFARLPFSAWAPVITQARAWYDSTGMYVDLYVGNPISASVPRLARMTIAHDLNGYEQLDGCWNQLVPVPFRVNAALPSGAVSQAVNTYR
jgi:hypothetical protein